MLALLTVAAPAAAALSVAAAAPAAPGTASPAALVDPRAGGLTVGLGEWAVSPEAPAIRPGTVTFLARNGGRVVHGLRVKQETRRHGGDRFKARTVVLRPGRTARLTVTLPPGVYSLECFVEGHDDLGMERRFEVRADAPLVRGSRPAGGTPTVAIAGFAFEPATLTVKPGTTVRWANQDEAPHTVTATSGAFTSNELRKGGAYTRRFASAGTFAYLCALHPGMQGRVVVSGR